MKQHSKLLGLGLAAFLSVGLLAAPGLASAQSYRHRSSTHNEDTARTNAIALGAAGVLLMSNHQQGLGTIALGAAAYETIQMQNAIKDRHNRERYGYYNGRYYGSSDRYGTYNGYDRYGNYTGYDRNGNYSGSDRCGNNNGYDRNSGYYNAGSYRRGDGDSDDCNNSDRNGRRRNRGREWAATRGEKRGWDHNGKRD